MAQEPGAGNVITYPRNLEGIVRKTDTRRRSAREARAERKAAETAALEAEVKRRKAEKRRELQQRCAASRHSLDFVEGVSRSVDVLRAPCCACKTSGSFDVLPKESCPGGID